MLKFYLSRVMSLVAVLAMVVSFSSCKDDDKNDPEVTPVVKLTAKSSTESSVTFTVTPQDASKCAYAYVKKGEALPSAADILSKGTAAAADKASDATISGLDPETTYAIVAVVSNDSRTGEVVKLEMTTLVDPTSVPAVALEKGAEEAGKLTFTVTPTNSTTCAYVCLAPGEQVPLAGAILEKGTQAEAAEASVIAVEGLEPNTKYVIAAASANGDKQSPVVQIEMTTGAYGLDFAGKIATAEYYGDLGTGTGNYFVGVAGDDDATVFYFDLYEAVANDPEKAALPAGVYVVDAEGTAAMNTSSAFMTLLIETDDKGEEVETYPKDGTVTVSVEGTSYKIVAVMTLEDDRVVRCTYTGAVPISNQMDSDKGIDHIQSDVNMTFSHVEAYYWGDAYDYGTGNFMLNFADVEIKNSYLTAPGAMMVVDLSTELLKYSADMTIPVGTYNVSMRPDKGTYMSGYVAGPAGLEFALGTFLMKIGSNDDATYGLASSGTITIAKSGTGYKVDFNLNTNRGRKIQATYTGAIPVMKSGGGSDEPTTTLTADYDMELDHVKTANLTYFGDYFKKGTGAWILSLATKAVGTDGFSAMLFTKKPDLAAGLDAGVYNIGENYAAATYYPGQLNASEGTVSGTYYGGGYNSEGSITKFAPARAGDISVVKKDGNTTFYINLYDDASPSNCFSAIWTGPVNVIDKSASASSAPRLSEAAVLRPGMLPQASGAKSATPDRRAAQAERAQKHEAGKSAKADFRIGISR